MKTKYFFLIISLFCSSLAYAQSNSFNRLFEKYENEDDITVINISKAMFNLIPGNLKTGNVDIKNIVPKIESLRMLTSDKSSLKDKMASDFKSFVDKDKDYEELMRIKSGQTNITFNLKKKGEVISELIMLIIDNEDFVVVQILGNFLLDDIKKIAEDANDTIINP